MTNEKTIFKICFSGPIDVQHHETPKNIATAKRQRTKKGWSSSGMDRLVRTESVAVGRGRYDAISRHFCVPPKHAFGRHPSSGIS
jgi:hypothetical protein